MCLVLDEGCVSNPVCARAMKALETQTGQGSTSTWATARESTVATWSVFFVCPSSQLPDRSSLTVHSGVSVGVFAPLVITFAAAIRRMKVPPVKGSTAQRHPTGLTSLWVPLAALRSMGLTDRSIAVAGGCVMPILGYACVQLDSRAQAVTERDAMASTCSRAKGGWRPRQRDATQGGNASHMASWQTGQGAP